MGDILTVKQKESLEKVFDILHYYLYDGSNDNIDDVEWVLLENDRETVKELRHELLGKDLS